MTDTKTPETKPEEAPKASWLQRQAVGTAISAGVGTLGGVVWHAIKKKPLMSGMKGGAIAGVVASLGFAGYIYDGIFGSKKDGQVDKLNEKNAQTLSEGVQR